MNRFAWVAAALAVAATGMAEERGAPQRQQTQPRRDIQSVDDRSSTAETRTRTESFSRFQVSGELLGTGLLYSVYGTFRPFKMLAFNAGFSYWGVSSGSVSGGSGTLSASVNAMLIPLSASVLLGGENNFFEITGGGSIISANGTAGASGLTASATGNSLIWQFGAGYRYWPSDGGFHFRAMGYGIYLPGYSNTVGTSTVSTNGQFYPYLGLSFGYAFSG